MPASSRKPLPPLVQVALRHARSSLARRDESQARFAAAPGHAPSLGDRIAQRPARPARSRSKSSSKSSRFGVANSAAADGVGARKPSATKSTMVKSISCPTPLITGIRLLATARATPSSLKHHKSSSEPPPRAMMIVSISSRRLSRASAATICAVALQAPCTSVGLNTTSTSGKRPAQHIL